MTNSLSESRSEKLSKEGNPPSVDAPNVSKAFVNCDSALVGYVWMSRKSLRSSSSAGKNVGRVGKST